MIIISLRKEKRDINNVSTLFVKEQSLCAQGPARPASGLSQYAYIYNQIAQVVPIEADVTFDTNGIMTPGITHAPGTSQIQVTTPGNYLVTFSA